MKPVVAIAVVLAVVGLQPARAQDLSPRVRAAAFLEVVAARGLDCGLLRPWQAAALRALNLRDMEGWDAAARADVVSEVERRTAETTCGNDAMNAWIEGSRAGFDREMLPPYLVAYRALARVAAPPKVFAQTALRLDFAPAIRAIDAKLAALEAAGVVPEGGRPWPDYVGRTEGFVDALTATLADPGAAAEVDQAAAWIAQTAHVVELWLLDGEG